MSTGSARKYLVIQSIEKGRIGWELSTEKIPVPADIKSADKEQPDGCDITRTTVISSAVITACNRYSPSNAFALSTVFHHFAK